MRSTRRAIAMGRKASAILLDASVLQAIAAEPKVASRLRGAKRWCVPALSYLEALTIAASRDDCGAARLRFFESLGFEVLPLDLAAIANVEGVRSGLAAGGAGTIDPASASVLVAAEQLGCGIVTCQAVFAARFADYLKAMGLQIELLSAPASTSMAG